VYGNARIVSINPISLFNSVEAGHIPVICGFQGTYIKGDGAPGGELTTLGRGGSDTTGSAIGAAMRAEAVEIFTDVDGVKTADPDAVREAPTLRKVTYDEVAEIAHLGARVIHPRAAEIAMHYGIPLWVKNTFSEDEGTEIVPKEKFPGRRATGVTHTGKLVYMQFDLKGAEDDDRSILERHMYETFARYGVHLYMLNLSPGSTGFAVNRHEYGIVVDVLDGLVVPIGEARRVYLFQIGDHASREVETQASLLGAFGDVRRISARLTEGCTMVSLVGHEFMQQAGLFLAVLQTLEDGQVTALQTSDSDYSLSVLVPEAETNRAVRLLHDRFQLAEVR
jgi:aspartate kinase